MTLIFRLTIAVTLIGLAGCVTNYAPNAPPPKPSPKPPTATATTATANVLACREYAPAFNAFSHSTGDGIVAASKLETKLTAAEAEAAGQLKVDLAAVQTGLLSVFGGASINSFVKTAEKAYVDCFKLGIT